jgi:hypothetical protein
MKPLQYCDERPTPGAAAVADEWLVKVEREGRSAVTMKKLRWLLDFINAALNQPRATPSSFVHET